MSDIHVEEHSSPIKTPQQLITVVVLALAVPIAIIVLLTQFLTTGIKLEPNSPAMTPEFVAQRLKPVGQMVVEAGGGTQAAKTGEEVVKAVCAACHASGALNAPKIGDSAAWGKLAGEGLAQLTEHAIKGKGSMPAKGGNPSLSDFEISRAIVYMANQSGQKLKEPAAPAAAAAAAPATGERTGEQVVRAACGKCHETGAGGAPKVGDKSAWGPRVSKGLDAVTRLAIKGHGGMPARGGLADLTDSEVTAAILYMFIKGGGEATKASAKPAAATEAAIVAAAPAAAAADGKAVYEKNCVACHMTGAAGAPKAGDKAEWGPRLKEGMDHLYEHAIKGKGAMPPKGGNANLSDAEVKAAVNYLTSLAK